MSEIHWTLFSEHLGERQSLPREREPVLLRFPPRGNLPTAVAVGYLRFAAGDRDSPFFVTPGFGGTPSHWSRGLELPGDEREAIRILWCEPA